MLSFFDVPARRAVAGRDVEWFTPTDHCRGPWDADACHAGPPTGLIVRAMERAVPIRLARVTADLSRTIPMAGFGIDIEVVRQGRTVATTRATIVDGDGATRVTATGLHVAARYEPLFPETLDNSGIATPSLTSAVPGPFPIDASAGHGLAGFSGVAVETRFPRDEGRLPSPATVWMRTAALLPGESPSPFQAICPIADCGNAFSRHAEPWEIGFVNTDLTIALHRPPAGEWFASRAVSWWQPDGIGLADAVLFDEAGAVGRALQTMVLRPAAPH